MRFKKLSCALLSLITVAPIVTLFSCSQEKKEEIEETYSLNGGSLELQGTEQSPGADTKKWEVRNSKKELAVAVFSISVVNGSTPKWMIIENGFLKWKDDCETGVYQIVVRAIVSNKTVLNSDIITLTISERTIFKISLSSATPVSVSGPSINTIINGQGYIGQLSLDQTINDKVIFVNRIYYINKKLGYEVEIPRKKFDSDIGFTFKSKTNTLTIDKAVFISNDVIIDAKLTDKFGAKIINLPETDYSFPAWQDASEYKWRTGGAVFYNIHLIDDDLEIIEGFDDDTKWEKSCTGFCDIGELTINLGAKELKLSKDDTNPNALVLTIVDDALSCSLDFNISIAFGFFTFTATEIATGNQYKKTVKIHVYEKNI